MYRDKKAYSSEHKEYDLFDLNLPMLSSLSFKAQGCRDFKNHLNPVMLVFIG